MADTRSIIITQPSDVVYVTGVINDENYTFTRQDGDTWVTDVTRSDDDMYRCTITAVTSSGNSTTWSTVLYYGLHLITDRTMEDVEYIKSLSTKSLLNMTGEELSDYLAGECKGAYNYQDLNRVESAVLYVATRLAQAGVIFNPVIKNIWTVTEWPTISEMERYLDNIRTLRDALPLPDDTPEVTSSMHNLAYYEANDLERILEVVDAVITNIIKGFYYSGDLYGGEI